MTLVASARVVQRDLAHGNSRGGSGCCGLAVQFFRTAYEVMATDVETQEPVGLAREADPPADSYFRGGMVVTREPQGPHAAEVDAVQTTIDIERSCKTTWPSRQVAQVLNPTIALHRSYAVQWFKRPDQDARSDANSLTRDVEHVRRAIGKINIRMPTREEERPIPRCHAYMGMPRCITDRIGFGLDDTAAQRAFRCLANQQLAYQVSGEQDRVERQFRP